MKSSKLSAFSFVGKANKLYLREERILLRGMEIIARNEIIQS